MDETYIKVKGVWTSLYRAVDSRGQTIDFLLSARRDAAAAKPFFHKALAQPHTVNPRTITVDKNPVYPRATADMKRAGELWRFSRLRQCKYLNNIIETGSPPDHTAGATRAWLRQSANRQTDAGWLQGDGNDQEGAGSQR